MLMALCIFFSMAITSTLYLENLYNLAHLADGTFIPGPDFEANTINALKAFTSLSILVYIGLWTIKVNFLLFFYRLGYQLPRFRIIWWIFLVIVLATGCIQIGVIQYDCMLTDLNTLATYCSSEEYLRRTRKGFIVSVTFDILSDFLSMLLLRDASYRLPKTPLLTPITVVICFPAMILWTSRINLRQKLVLSGIFSLIGITIAVTVVRGGFSINIEKPGVATELNTSFCFWIALEYFVCKYPLIHTLMDCHNMSLRNVATDYVCKHFSSLALYRFAHYLLKSVTKLVTRLNARHSGNGYPLATPAPLAKAGVASFASCMLVCSILARR